MLQIEKTEQEKKTFAIFSQSSNIQGKSNKSAIDYANGFSILMQRYDSIHNTNISGLVNTTNIVEHKKNSLQNVIVESKEFYIENRLHSQTIFDKNGDIWVMYPKIKNKHVDGLLIASYTDNGTNVFFSYVKKDSELFAINLNLFQLEYDKKFNSSINKKANGDNCGFEGLPSCDLDEVIITPNPGGSGCSNCYTTPPENGGSSGCSQFVECLDNPPGGGGGGGIISPFKTPCDKIKPIGKNDKSKSLMKDLKIKTSENKEHVYILNADGNNINETHFEGNEGEAGVDFNFYGQIDVFLHSHFKGLLPVFSADDILNLTYLYKNGFIKDANSFVFGLVTENTQYYIIIDDFESFDNFSNIVMMGGNEISDSVYDYYNPVYQSSGIKESNSVSTNEYLFLKYLEAQKSGLKLLKSDSELNDWKLLSSATNGKINETKCN
ncbi:MAG: hypothetical protein ACRC8Z_06910 [Empedobacter falsenii]